MSGRLFLAGVSHQDCPDDLAAKLFRDPQDLPDILRWLDDGPLDGALWLATCNRLQVMGELAAGAVLPADELQQAMARVTGTAAADIAMQWRCWQGDHAVAQLCRITSSLDSARVGEPFIAGQVAESWRMTCRAGLDSPALSQAVVTAQDFAEYCRDQLGLCDHPADLPAAVLMEIGTACHRLKGLHIGFIGWHAEDGPALCRALRQEGAARLWLQTPVAGADLPVELIAHGLHPADDLAACDFIIDLAGMADDPAIPQLCLCADAEDRQRLERRITQGRAKLAQAVEQAEARLADITQP